MVVVPINGITDVHMKRNVKLMHRNPGVMAVNNVFLGKKLGYIIYLLRY